MKRVLCTALLGILAMPFAVNALELTENKTLTEDVTDGIVVSAGKTVTLDLGGFDITNTGSATIIVEEGASLTIKGEGAVTNASHGMPVILNNGTLVVEDGTYYRNNVLGTNDEYVVLNRGEMTVEGGVFKIDGGEHSLIDNGWYTPSENTTGKMAELTINGGEFTMTNNDKYIKNDDYGIMTVNGGTFTMYNPSSAIIGNIGSVVGEETLTINGGTFNYTGDNYAIWDYAWSDADASVTVVNGGVFNITDENAAVTNVELAEDVKQYPVLGTDNYVVADPDTLENVVESEPKTEASMTKEEIDLIAGIMKEDQGIAGYFDVNLYKATSDKIKVEQLSSVPNAVKVTLPIPSALQKVAEGYTRTYSVIRVHTDENGEMSVTQIPAKDNGDNTVTFESSLFSTYALVYTDAKVENNVATSDDIVMYFAIGAISLAAVAGCGFQLRKRFN